MKISQILFIAGALTAASPTFAEGGAERTLDRLAQASRTKTPVPAAAVARDTGRDSQGPAAPHSRC